jgi:hypothetical protein
MVAGAGNAFVSNVVEKQQGKRMTWKENAFHV